VKQYAWVDGLFEVEYVSFRQPENVAHRVTVVCRAGRLFGADPRGGIYTGVLKTRTRQRQVGLRSCLKVAYEIPPRAKPAPGVTGDETGGPADGSTAITVPILGEIDPWARHQNTTVLVGGKPVDIEITYLGPLPQ
jgi:hypothetical protein